MAALTTVFLASWRGLGAGRILVVWAWSAGVLQRVLFVPEQQPGQDGEEPGEDEPGAEDDEEAAALT